ncbi:hypothetical protein EMPS_00071 [Entomortierella parvispora]|uniref:Uncharacterized protein n=1 Tax=Entomortierella parvispora TaxID=205924 RepID=A0A9P3GZ47_9FUNG|nr:hypothetical protein EMPS_00071 [Entomortierella parvispora]
MVVTNAVVIFESISFIALCLRPSHNNHSNGNNNSDQSIKSDASMQEAGSIAVVKPIPAIASTSAPASSLWSKIQLPPFTTLRHAKWMYGYSLISVVCTPLLISVLRYHKYWPNLWPWIWNDPFWMELVSGITASMDADMLVETSWQKLDFTLRPILGVIMTVWGLRVWIRKMEEGQEDKADK